MGALLSPFVAEQGDRRKALLEKVHPVYSQHVTEWNVGLDAYDGTGGFLTGDYLWRFPREDDDQFAGRKKQARYHNYTETLVDIYTRHLVEGVTRASRDEALTAWWDDVDGHGTAMDTYMLAATGQALASGHAGILVDKAPGEPTGPSRAEAIPPYLATFTAIEILDWRVDQFGLAAVKLREERAGAALGAPLLDAGFLLWDREDWLRFGAKGEFLGGNSHELAQVPLVMLRLKPSRRHPFIGKPLVPSSTILALYNRASEEDLVLRDQAFSLFVVEVPIDAQPSDVDAVNAMLSRGVGTTTALVVKGTTNFRTADMQVPKTIREGQAALVHEIYRQAHLRFQRDSLDAESAEALRLQRADFTQTLRGMADVLMDLERQIAFLYYAWQAPDAARAFERAQVEVSYPKDYDLPDLERELTALQAAMALNLGPTATREIRERAVILTLPDLSADTLQLVKDELAQAPATGAQGLRDEAANRLRQAGITVDTAA